VRHSSRVNIEKNANASPCGDNFSRCFFWRVLLWCFRSGLLLWSSCCGLPSGVSVQVFRPEFLFRSSVGVSLCVVPALDLLLVSSLGVVICSGPLAWCFHLRTTRGAELLGCAYVCFLWVPMQEARQGGLARNTGGGQAVKSCRGPRTGNDGGGQVRDGARAVDMGGEPVKDYLLKAR
jgi:hypothetical protein